MKYCISDVHGCSKTLVALLEKIDLQPTDVVYFLGDYVDRGPDSKGVLDIVMNLDNAVCHKGNHEDMLLRAINNQNDVNAQAHWWQNGGAACIESFGGDVGSEYLAFISSLKLITELDKFYLCHAGISNEALNTPEEVILWDRTCEVDIAKTGGRKLICGHTPTDLDTIKSDLICEDKIIIDAGCVFSHYEEYGYLVALRLDDMKVYEQRNIDVKV